MKLNSELNFSNLVKRIFLKPREKISQTSRHVTANTLILFLYEPSKIQPYFHKNLYRSCRKQ